MQLDNLLKDQLVERPDFNVGDTVRVHTRIKEGDKERIQVFEGVVLKRARGKGRAGNFTVRRIASGVGVERTFMLHSPNVQDIEVIRRGVVRRARLYYLRDLKTRSMNIKEKRVVKNDATAETAKKKPAKAKAEAAPETEAPAAE
jgi:large subunit ribosomal protein L19